MSNDIKSQPQPAPAALGRSPRGVNLAGRVPVPSRDGAAKGFNVAQVYRDGGMVFRPEGSDFSVPAATPELPTQIMSRVRKFADPSLTKYKWSRPLLIDSALQTEFDVTYSKQTTEKFLTGARTHISDFGKLPNLSPVSSRKKLSKRLRRAGAKRQRISPLLAAPPTPFLSKVPALKTAFLPGSDQNIENDVTYRKQRTENFLPGPQPPIAAYTFLRKKRSPLRPNPAQNGLASALSNTLNCPIGASVPPAAAAIARIAD
jgi:hypothetical protein